MENGCLLIPFGGEESSAANDYVKLFVHTDLASLQFDPGGYLSGGFVFDPGGSFQFNPHGFIQSTSALASGETNGNQHQLFLHCPTELTKCSKFFKAPHPIYHVLFYLLHGGKLHDDDSHKCYCG